MPPPAVLASAIFVNVSWFVGQAPDAGWFNYVPLALRPFSPGLSIDFYAFALLFNTVSTTATSINLVTTIFKLPGYQTIFSNAPQHRMLPDVAALGDSNTGWDIITLGEHAQIGGTSAAAPLWAGLAALVNQDLKKKGLKPMGAANPAISWSAQRASQFRAFHDVTVGNNLYFTAGQGYDLTTGWGTPSAPGLLAGFEAYQRSH